METGSTQSSQELLSIGPAARLVGVAVETLRRYEREGRISATRTAGGERRFRVADLHALLDEFAAQAKPSTSTPTEKAS
jgi:excisionase family DNA binding protein